MALEVKINIVDTVFTTIPVGTKVADVVITGSDDPTFTIYSPEYLVTQTQVTTTVEITPDNLKAIHFDVTDRHLGETVVINNIYPKVTAKDLNKFSKPNMIYKVTKDINLNNCILTIPAGCTLDFQGGSISNGTIVGSLTKIIAGLLRIFNISTIIKGTWNIDKPHPEWFEAVVTNIGIQKCIDYFNKCYLTNGSYNISDSIYLKNNSYLSGININTTLTLNNALVDAIVFSQNCRFAKVTDLTITSSSKAGKALSFDSTSAGANMTFERLLITNFAYGVYAKDTFWNNYFNDVRIQGCTFGIFIDSPSGNSINCLFNKLYIESCESLLTLKGVLTYTFVSGNFGGTATSPYFVFIDRGSKGVSFIGCNFEYFRNKNTSALNIVSNSTVCFNTCTFINIVGTNTTSDSILQCRDTSNTTLLNCAIINSSTLLYIIAQDTASVELQGLPASLTNKIVGNAIINHNYNLRKVGTTAQRPTNAPGGYTYFDSTLTKYIFYTGSLWLNMDGTSLT